MSGITAGESDGKKMAAFALVMSEPKLKHLIEAINNIMLSKQSLPSSILKEELGVNTDVDDTEIIVKLYLLKYALDEKPLANFIETKCNHNIRLFYLFNGICETHPEFGNWVIDHWLYSAKNGMLDRCSKQPLIDAYFRYHDYL